MDKLEPLIKHRFWILTGLIVPLAIYGYYSANSQLKAATESRESQLESVVNGVDSGNKPNEDYAEKLGRINERYEVWVNETVVDLWKHQQERMTWPSLVESYIPDEFLGEIPPNGLVIYEGLYDQVILDLEQRVQPVDELQNRTVQGPRRPEVSETPNQKVVLATNVPTANLDRLTITSQQMWDAQIDVWLTRLLLDAVVRLNADKDTVTEANLRRIDRLELLGGTGTPVLDGSSGGGGMPSMIGGMPADLAASMGMGGGSSAPTPLVIPTETEFDPAEEFGADSDQAATAGPPSTSMLGAMMSETPAKRYINESEAAPYLERGFYMTVIIMQDQIANFLEELVNSPWPVRIERFHVGANPYRTDPPPFRALAPTSGGMGGFGMGPGTGESPFGGRGFGGRGGRGFGRGGSSNPFESMGRGNQRRRTGQNLPAYATAALNHPDLVQMDLCGVITIYKQPKEAMEALATAQPAANPAATFGAPAGQSVVGEEVVPVDPEITVDTAAELDTGVPLTEEAPADAAPATAAEAEVNPESTADPGP